MDEFEINFSKTAEKNVCEPTCNLKERRKKMMIHNDTLCQEFVMYEMRRAFTCIRRLSRRTSFHFMAKKLSSLRKKNSAAFEHISMTELISAAISLPLCYRVGQGNLNLTGISTAALVWMYRKECSYTKQFVAIQLVEISCNIQLKMHLHELDPL